MKYFVNVCKTAGVYEIEADSKEQAEREAAELFKRDKDTWMDPCHVEAGEV